VELTLRNTVLSFFIQHQTQHREY